MHNSSMAPPAAICDKAKRIDEGKPVTIPMFRIPVSSGRSKGLYIGINYPGSGVDLRGCVADVRASSEFFKKMYSFPTEGNMLVMTDEPMNVGTPLFPNKENIMHALKWLTDDALPGDSLFLHYSGHGGLKWDEEGKEISGYDQTIYPADYRTNGPIDDDTLHEILVQNIPCGCKLTALFDSCHSGTVLDLPFVYEANGRLVEPKKSGIIGRLIENAARVIGCSTARTRRSTRANSISGFVIAFSASEDQELSTDVCDISGCYGVMSRAFISELKKNPSMTYTELLKASRKTVRKYKQTPCLSSSIQADMNVPFSL